MEGGAILKNYAKEKMISKLFYFFGNVTVHQWPSSS